MKCPECGQWNRASMPHCIRCGAPLNIDEASRLAWKSSLKDDAKPASYLRADEFGLVENAPDARDSLAREMQDLKKRKQEGAELLDRLRSRSAASAAAGVVVEEETPASGRDSLRRQETFRLRRVSPTGEAAMRETETRHRVRYMDDAGAYVEKRIYDPIIPQTAEEALQPPPFTSRMPVILPSRERRRKTALRVLLVFVLVILLGTGGYFTWRFFSERSRLLKSGEPQAIVTASLKDEVAAHIIQIPGTDGDSINIRELHASYNVSGGFASIEVPDHTWYDNVEGALGETMDVTLTPS